MYVTVGKLPSVDVHVTSTVLTELGIHAPTSVFKLCCYITMLGLQITYSLITDLRIPLMALLGLRILGSVFVSGQPTSVFQNLGKKSVVG